MEWNFAISHLIYDAWKDENLNSHLSNFSANLREGKAIKWNLLRLKIKYFKWFSWGLNWCEDNFS